jgi:diguanylate cyclase (GGDEF)-like protein/PAS domain S-box-containing protein
MSSPTADKPDRLGIATRMAAYDSLVQDHTNVSVVAFARTALFMPLPAELPLYGSRAVEGHNSVMEVLDRSCGGDVLEAWDRMIEDGAANTPVRAGGRELMLHLIDLRERYEVIVGVFIGHLAGPTPLESSPFAPRLAVMFKDELSVITGIDEAVTAMLGWTADEMVGRRSLEFVHFQDQDYAVATWMRMLSMPGASTRLRLRHRHRDRSWRWLEVTNHYWPGDPDNHRVVTQLIDVSSEVDALNALRANERLLTRLADALPVGVLYVEADRRIAYCNSRMTDLAGVKPTRQIEDQLGKVVPADRTRILAALEAALTTGEDSDIEVSVGYAATEIRRCVLSLRPVTNEDHRVTGAITCLTDITTQASHREELERRVRFDSLTECLNRLSIMDELQQRLDQTGVDTWTVAAFVDLDDFKAINDQYGHFMGDQLLRHVADQLRAEVGPDGAVGRIGGDEFLVVHSIPAAEHALADLGDRLSVALRRPVRTAHGEVTAGGSVGLAYANASAHNDTDAVELVAAADAAMYRSKQRGRGSPATSREGV